MSMLKNSDSVSAQDSKSNLPVYLSAALVGGTVALYFLVPDAQAFMDEIWQVLTSNDEQRIKQWVSNFGWLGPIVLTLAMVAQMFLLVIPTILLMIVSILAYGPVWGSVIILCGVFMASSVGYFIGHYLSQTFVMRLLGKKTENNIEQFIELYGFWAVIVTRLNPFLSNDAISFVGGIVKMSYWRFISATMVGILPLTIFIAILGEDINTLKSGLFWGSLVSLVIFIGYVFWNKK